MTHQKYFKYDLERFFAIKCPERSSFAGKVRLIIDNFGIQCVAIYRMRKFCQRLYHANRVLGFPIYLFATVVAIVNEVLMGIHFSLTAEIGPGLFIAHPLGIFLTGKIGRNCTVHQGVTIGWGYTNENYGTPTIGENVWISPNVVISGKISVGDGATISAGSIVSRDIPENALAVGNPCRIVSIDYGRESFERTYLPADR